MYYRNIPSGGNSVVECLLAKEDVASSSLVSRSILIKEIGSPVKGLFLLQIYQRRGGTHDIEKLTLFVAPSICSCVFICILGYNLQNVNI